MATRQNTKNAIPSNALADLSENAIILDEWTNGSSDYTTDRFGNKFKTRKKILADLQIAVEGIQSKSFLPITGGTVTGSTNFSAGVKSKGSDVFTVNGGTVTGKTNFTGGLQSSGVDVLKVGDGGIALSTQTATNNIDIDAYDFKVGFYSGNNWSSTVGLPFGSTSKNEWFYLLNQNLATLGDKYKLQLLGSNGKNQLAFRNITNGVPREFVEIITTENVASYAAGLGIGQTWQDVKASRTFGTTYTNTTEKPILVSCAHGKGVAYYELTGKVGNTVVAYTSFTDDWNNITTLTFIVPAGAEYSVTSTSVHTQGIYFWSELR